MSTITSTTELRRMTMAELRQELLVKRVEYAKMRLGIEMQKEKNHAAFKTKRKEIARMCTVMTGMQKNQRNEQSDAAKNSPVSSLPSVALAKEGESSVKASQTAKKPVKSPRSKAKKA